MISVWTTLAVAVVAAWMLGYFAAPLWLWTVVAAALLYVGDAGPIAWCVFALIAALFNVPPLRRTLIAAPLLTVFRRVLPAISETEREALDARHGMVGG